MFTIKKVEKPKKFHKSYLEQTAGPEQGRTFELSRDILSIGRTDDNEIVLRSDSVSRCHAFLKKAPTGEWHFQDNNSKNGIRVNGTRVTDYKLLGGDVLEIGDYTFLFHECGTQTSLDMQGTEIVDISAPKKPAPPPPKKPEAPAAPVATSGTEGEKPASPAAVPLAVVHPPKPRPTLKDKLEGARAKVQAVKPFIENHSWLMGVVVGVLIGGGLWYKATRSGTRPQARQAAVEARQDSADRKTASRARDIRDLKLYLRDGREYLREGDKESAAIAFRFALVIDPGNAEAIKGLKAAGGQPDPSSQAERRNPAQADPSSRAERSTPPQADSSSRAKRSDPPSAPPAPAQKAEAPPAPAPKPAQATAPTPSPEQLKAREQARARAKVAELLKGAVDSYNKRRYQEAIDRADQARQIEIPDQTAYLNEAKQIIDRARMKQKEDFEPFLQSALQKIEQGDFAASSLLCEEMLRTDPTYRPAKECLAKSVEGVAAAGKGVQ